MKFTIQQGAKGFWWRLEAANGKVLANSSMYGKKDQAVQSATLVLNQANGAEILDETTRA